MIISACRSIFHKSCHSRTQLHFAQQLIKQQPHFTSRLCDVAVCRRRVLELGSGSIKCQVSDVDVKTNTIIQNISTNSATVLFTRDLKIQEQAAAKTTTMNSATYSFSPSIQLEGVRAIQKLLLDTDIYRPEKTVGVATEAFRKAANGAQLASTISSECNLPVTILPTEKEAGFGFETAAAISGVQERRKLISWDCGAGSFQISSYCHGLHVDSHGSGTVTEMAEPLRDRGMSPRAVAECLLDILSHQLAPVPKSIKNAIQNNCPVVAIGSQHSIFNQQRILSGNAFFTQEDVKRSIQATTALDPTLLPKLELQQSQLHGDADDQDTKRCIENATFMVPKLVLLLATMRHVGISKATFYKTNGNCAALLVQPWLWEADMER